MTFDWKPRDYADGEIVNFQTGVGYADFSPIEEKYRWSAYLGDQAVEGEAGNLLSAKRHVESFLKVAAEENLRISIESQAKEKGEI